ncbi:MAG: LytTR family DNA-binding domain-containing protein [Anaerovoracaceae bacterium]
MIHIALCDDCLAEMLKVEELVKEYEANNSAINFTIDSFPMSVELASEIEKGRTWDIYILDLLMPQTSGIDLGRIIRKYNGTGAIIYETSSKDYALEAFEIKAARYIMKPINKKEVFEALDHSIRLITPDKEKSFTIKSGDGLKAVPTNRISYIECFKRRAYFHLIGGQVIESILLRGSFEEYIDELLKKDNFVQIHKSYVVNMINVDGINNECVVMTSGEELGITKRNVAAFKKKYLEYIAK